MITNWNFVFVIGFKPLYFKQMFYFDDSVYTCNGSLLFNRTGKKKSVLAFLIQAAQHDHSKKQKSLYILHTHYIYIFHFT